MKKFDSNAYKLEIFQDLGINLVFNIEDLTPIYHTPFDFLAVIPDSFSSAFMGKQRFPIHPPPPSPRKYHNEEIEVYG